MKKKVSLALLLAAGLVAVSPVSAMTEDELRAKLTQTYKVNGVEVKANKDQIAKIDKYLEEVNVTAADADEVSKLINEAIEVVDKSDAKSWKELQEKGTVTQLVDITNKAADLESISVSLSTDGTVTVKYPRNHEKAGQTFDEVKVTDSKITNTDDSMAIVLSSGIAISLVGLLLVTKKVVKANA